MCVKSFNMASHNSHNFIISSPDDFRFLIDKDINLYAKKVLMRRGINVPITPKKSKRKRVSFSKETKHYDGLRHKLFVFDNSIIKGMTYDVFRCPNSYINFLGDDIVYLPDVFDLLNDLIVRINSSSNLVPILPGGGGSMAKVGVNQLNWLLWFSVIVKVCLNRYVK